MFSIVIPSWNNLAYLKLKKDCSNQSLGRQAFVEYSDCISEISYGRL